MPAMYKLTIQEEECKKVIIGSEDNNKRIELPSLFGGAERVLIP